MSSSCLTFEKLNAGADSPWWDIFDYDHATGRLHWRRKASRKLKVGSIAGVVSCGYVKVRYKGKRYLGHRIVWEMFNGTIPDGMEVDHIDIDKSNNRLGNLRLATPSQNQCNRSLQINSTTRIKGLSIYTSKGSTSWITKVKLGGKTTSKYFSYTEAGKLEAISHLERLREELHGHFRRHA